MAPASLATDTRVTRLAVAPGWYTADLPDSWSYVTPSGGVLMTLALRAMAAEINDPSLRPVSATTLFCSPVPSGPLEVRVVVIRRGNAAVQLRAALSSTTLPGPGLEVSATFARDREGPSYLDAVMPAALPPGAGAKPAKHDERYRFLQNFDIGRALADEPARAGERGEARFAQWYRYRVPQPGPGGALDPFTLPPLADTMPPAVARKLGPGAPSFHAPSLDLTVHFLEPAPADWILVHSRSRAARAGYATADVDIWSSEGALLAFATQTMMLRRGKPA